MQILRQEIEIKLAEVEDKEIINNLRNSSSVYPFNDIELTLSYLLYLGILDLDEYIKMRNDYFDRNKYLYVFEMSGPRDFGENWAQRFIQDQVPVLVKPNKNEDISFDGEYDFWLDGIKIEVKASRAVEKRSGETLVKKALNYDSDKSFDMNFQQLKPLCCDIFIWIGVWKDTVKYWVLSSQEVIDNRYYSQGQHRGNTNEGQLWIKQSNIREFDTYLVEVENIVEVIRLKSR